MEIQDVMARQYQDVWSPNDLCLKINPPKQGPVHALLNQNKRTHLGSRYI